jgi:hypothetical protein
VGAWDAAKLRRLLQRRFPPPWSVEEPDKLDRRCFIVRDGNGQALAYVYFEQERGRRAVKHPHLDAAFAYATPSCGLRYCTIAEVQESTNVAREASFDEAKAQHQCSTGAERRRIVIVPSKRSVCRNQQACSGCADAENRNESRNHSV